MEFKFCESDFYFLNGSKNCMVATYNFGSVYICQYKPKGVQLGGFVGQFACFLAGADPESIISSVRRGWRRSKPD